MTVSFMLFNQLIPDIEIYLRVAYISLAIAYRYHNTSVYCYASMVEAEEIIIYVWF